MAQEISSTSIHLGKPRTRDGFQLRKETCLSKRDKSSAGRIDPKAVQICHSINEFNDFYTLSSCAGRCFLYRGKGAKNSTDFVRYRVNHDLIREPERYFALHTLPPVHINGESDSNSIREQYDLTGGGDATPILKLGNFEDENVPKEEKQQTNEARANGTEGGAFSSVEQSAECQDPVVWLRFEPFILHVCCRTLTAAQTLMNTSRPIFKNVGLTAWKETLQKNNDNSKYVVAIWGDEGLEMPITTPDDPNQLIFAGKEEWLAELVNIRHKRNWEKIDNLNTAVTNNRSSLTDDTLYLEDSIDSQEFSFDQLATKKGYDKIGDVALLNSIPHEVGKEDWAALGESIMSKNKSIKIVAVRTSTLQTEFRSIGKDGIIIIAGPSRSPLITAHTEYGIKCVIDLENCFFSNRMGPERIRLCQQVARGERVLVLFSGVGMEALQLAGRTEAREVIAIEKNPISAQCARRGADILKRNKRLPCSGAFERLTLIEGDVIDILSGKVPPDCDPPVSFAPGSFDRILAPRPKEGKLDGDLGSGDAGVPFLELIIPLLRPDGGECHWYDFCADHELPNCERTKSTITRVCTKSGREMEVINIANAGSVAKKQYRICVDFRIIPTKSS